MKSPRSAPSTKTTALSWTRKALYSLLCILIFFGSFETILWGVGVGVEIATRSRSHPVSTTAQPGSVPRTIYCAGDSVTWGHGVAREDTYPSQLAAALGTRDEGVKISNIGGRGADFGRILSDLNDALADSGTADLLVLLLGGHNNCDLVDPHPPVGGSVVYPRLLSLMGSVRGLRTYRFLATLILKGADVADLEPRKAAIESTETASCKQEVAEGLAAAKETIDGLGGHTIVLTYTLDHDLARSNPRGPDARVCALNKILRTEASRVGLPLLDLEPCMAEQARGSSETLFLEGRGGSICRQRATRRWRSVS